ncbi:MAG TPA: universal stress protein [Gemmatimonadaceae bacterium]|nr:universal stress protein [Gemmatimonadaceae bacterium]
MYKIIMVPTDGSGFDRYAIRVALRVAERSQARVRLVRVQSTGAFFGTGSSPEAATVSVELLQEERDRILRELYALAAEYRNICDAEIGVALEDGPVPDALEAYASRNKVDLIVMSSHGRGGIARLSLGSVTDLLIRRTNIPILVVKPPASYLNPQAGDPFKRIIVPLDGSSLAEQILPEVVALAKLDESQLTLLHVVVPRNSSQKAIDDQQTPWSDMDIAAAQAYLFRIAATLREDGLLTTTDVVVGENIAQAIADYASRKRANLVAIATHGRGGISRALRGSVADVVRRTSRTSMLVYRPAGALAEEVPAREGPNTAFIPTPNPRSANALVSSVLLFMVRPPV